MKPANTQNRIPTATVAKLAGVHKDTLLRWLRSGKIAEPARDRRGWRIFTEDECEVIKEMAQSGFIKETPPVQYLNMVDKSIAEKLNSLDWDFDKAKTQYLTHSIHPYPAKYIPQIPNAIIQELSSIGDTVLDIFSGSGTTLVEALILRRNAIGIDANPLAVKISKAKTTPISQCGLAELSNLLEYCQRLLGEICVPTPNLFSTLKFETEAPRPDNKSIDFWFDEPVIHELAEILHQCNKIKDVDAKNLAITAFSSIVVSVSKQDSDTRYVRKEKNLSVGATTKKYINSLTSAIHGITEFSEMYEDKFSCKVIFDSVLNKPNLGKVDLVVCSPPYPNAYSYHLYHMTRMVWLDMDQPKFKVEEIGSHRKYSSRGKNAATIETFTAEMEEIFKWLSVTLKRDGFACFVIGDSTIKGEKIDNTSLLSAAASKCGFREITRIPRTIQSTKKSFNPKIGTIRNEYILVLKNCRED